MPAGYTDPLPRCQPRRRRSNADRRADDATLAIPKGAAIRVADDAVLDWARTLCWCEWCGRACPDGTDPSHTVSRGAGGPDSYWNVTALCRRCHDEHHRGHAPTAEQLLATARRREDVGRRHARRLAERSPAALMHRRFDAGGPPTPAPATSPCCSAPSPSTATTGRRCTGSDAR